MNLASNPPLLESLDALVKAQAGPNGLRGHLCIGVRGDGPTRWWHAAFDGGVPVTQFIDQLPDNVDVAVGLEAGEAEAALTSWSAPPRRGLPGLVAGDQALLTRFLERYLTHQSLIDLRTNRGRNTP